MANTKTVRVPHLGGIDAAFQMPHAYDASKPTVVLVNSLTTSSELYRAQFSNTKLNEAMNLLAIEPLGHGQTRTDSENFTYWDTAIMNLQVMDAMGIQKAFALGTSQGGWIVARMALLAPAKIQGIIPLGTSMDFESKRSQDMGCWDGVAAATPVINASTVKDLTPEFEPPAEYATFLCDSGFGQNCSTETREFWSKAVRSNYARDDGRRRMRMSLINLRERDGLYGRLSDVKCPVLWIHGTADVVYSVRNAEEEIKMFVGSPSAEVCVIKDGAHFLSASHPEKVDEALMSFVRRWHKT